MQDKATDLANEHNASQRASSSEPTIDNIPKIRRKKGSNGNKHGRFNGQKQRSIKRLFFEKYGEHEYYECWICKQPVSKDTVTVDHVASVSEYPEYALEPSNLRPAHKFCNNKRHIK